MTGTLKREVGIFGAVVMGLGSIIGTGVFVSIGIAAGVAGAAVVTAIVVAAALAACNGLSSAQLAANHAVSGGTYEYGYKWLFPAAGFTAGWMFLCAKAASAATAALGFAAYIQIVADWESATGRIIIALGVVVVLTGFVLSGLRRSNALNIAIVSVTLASLVAFIVVCLGSAKSTLPAASALIGAGDDGAAGGVAILQAAALMFVAYTGYGRIATLGEEIHEPRRNIPRAIIITLIVTAALYALVALAAVSVLSRGDFNQITDAGGAVLARAAGITGGPTTEAIVTTGAIIAMLGVLLNLLLGLSRVALAMGRRGDLPRLFARVNEEGTTPTPAVILVALLIIALIGFGDIKTTWSISAFTVLIYYALTNAAALRLSDAERFYPRIIAAIGLIGCLGLAFWVEPRIWLLGLALIAAGLVWHCAAKYLRRSTTDDTDGHG